MFGRLLGELRCTAASPVFGALLEGALERAVEVMFEDVRRRVFGGGVDGAEGDGGGNAEGGDGEGGRTGRSEEEEGEKPRLANMLPELAKWAHSALNTVPNELVDVRVFFPFLHSFFLLLFPFCLFCFVDANFFITFGALWG